MVALATLYHVEETSPARRIETPPLRIVKYVVRVTGDFQVRHHRAFRRIENDESGRTPASDEKPVIGFVESHRKIPTPFFQRPGRYDCLLISVHHGNVLCIGHIHENARALRLQLKRLGVGGERDAIQQPARNRINHAQRPVTEANIDAFRCRTRNDNYARPIGDSYSSP